MNRRKFLGLVPAVPLIAKAKAGVTIDLTDEIGQHFGLAPLKREGAAWVYREYVEDQSLEERREIYSDPSWKRTATLQELQDAYYREIVDRDADG